MRQTLVQALDEERKRTGMTHEAFALTLGISKRHWGRLLSGQQQPGVRVLANVLAAYPQLTGAVALELRALATVPEVAR